MFLSKLNLTLKFYVFYNLYFKKLEFKKVINTVLCCYKCSLKK